jgi:hypothetical protein
MAIKYINIFQSKALQNFPKWDFWFENKPSGNPGRRAFAQKRNDSKDGRRKKKFLIDVRVAGWFIFKTENPNLGKFWTALDWKILMYFITIWNILQTFMIFYDHLEDFVFIW